MCLHVRLGSSLSSVRWAGQPKVLVNRMVPAVLIDYVRTLEGRLKAKLEAGLPARTLVESFGMELM